ncbi:MAG: GNAT family N-acetyltransferase [Gemmatimonadota bacterium]|nr:GNAT family N-acetyltransferase [Gemmatimonadota bacterium]
MTQVLRPHDASGRVTLRNLALADAPFILELLNDPDFIARIADRQVRSLEDAERYLTNGPLAMYNELGFGLWCTELRTTGTPIGICGLLKRDWLEDVDIGFALLPEFRGRGYAREAALLALARGRDMHGLSRIAAIVQRGNDPSERLLAALGFAFEKMVQAAPGGPELQLFATR